MNVTTEINEAKSDLDIAYGELQRIELLLEEHLNNGDILPSDAQVISDSLSIVYSKVRRVRASL